MNRWFFGLLFLFWGQPFMWAQIPTNPLGLTPAKIKWSQINTEKIKVVFPRDLDSVGLKVANWVNTLWAANQPNIGGKREKIGIYINPYSTLSNGQVTVGPFRSEFKVRSPQFKNTLDWIKDLTIHEYQHVKQFANASQGITALARHTFGSWAWGGFAATALPRWFWEGDAVAAETGLTLSGRGREPAFLMEYRALIESNRLWSYEKAAAGSIKHYVPDWYHLGYYLTTYTRKTYGEHIWSSVVSDAVRYRKLFYPLSQSLKKHVGLKPKAIYAATMADISSWLNTKETEVTQRESWPHQTRKVFTHYTLPIPQADGSLLCVKGGLNQLPRIVQLDSQGHEKKIYSPGIQAEFPFQTMSFQKGWLAWAEYSQHVRWEATDYSIIKLLNIERGEAYKLGGGDHHFSPALSPSARQVAAIHVSNKLAQSVRIWNISTGQVSHEGQNNSGYVLSFPVWSGDEEFIFLVGEKDDRHSLLSYNIQTGAFNTLSPAFPFPLSHLHVHGSKIFFSAGVGTINNIYAYDLKEKKYYQLTHSLVGAFTPAVNTDGTVLFYTEYTADGLEIKQGALQGTEINFDLNVHENPYSGFLQKNMRTEFEESKDQQLETNTVQKFRKSSRLIHPHSLLPYIEHPLYELSVLSDNAFSTLSADAGVRYNANERNISGFGRIRYAGWFPELSLTFNQLQRASNQFQFSFRDDTTLLTNFFLEHWRENRLSAGVNVPLRFNDGNFLFRFNQGILYTQQWIDVEGRGTDIQNDRDTIIIGSAGRDRFRPLVKPTLSDVNFGALTFNTTFQVSQRRAAQHINTRFGLFLNVLYRQSLDRTTGSNSVQGNGLVFLPGIGKNHSWWMQANIEKHSILDAYVFSDVFNYPRGYSSLIHDQITGIKINYEMPLMYPDLAIGGLAFLKRIKANVFVDAAQVKLNFPFADIQNYWSSGVELTFDTRLLRLLEVDWGVRYSYVSHPEATISNRQHQFDFLVLSISDR